LQAVAFGEPGKWAKSRDFPPWLWHKLLPKSCSIQTIEYAVNLFDRLKIRHASRNLLLSQYAMDPGMTETFHASNPTMDLRFASSRRHLGKLAAREIASELRQRLDRQQEVRMVFAAAPSQSETLSQLIREPGIDWTRVTAFHMDEYLGLPSGSPQLFHEWLRRTIFEHFPFKAAHMIEPGEDPERTCIEYAALLQPAPLDLCLPGIRTNPHLAFNEAPAKFDNPKSVNIVRLDAVCRQQQVDKGCFVYLEDVPTQAITLSMAQ
jgi:glucosamine-6-phosphate deaminase